MTMQPFGQAATHKPHPLHRSVSIIIFPAIFTFRIYPEIQADGFYHRQILL